MSRRSGPNGDDIHLDDENIKEGTLRRSGRRRFDKGTTVSHFIDFDGVINIFVAS